MNDENEEKDDDEGRVFHIESIGPSLCYCCYSLTLRSHRRIDCRSAGVLCDRPMLSGNFLLEATAKEVTNMIRNRFDIPVTFCGEARAAFIGLLYKYFGPGVFLLDAVWRVYKAVPS